MVCFLVMTNGLSSSVREIFLSQNPKHRVTKGRLNGRKENPTAVNKKPVIAIIEKTHKNLGC